MPKNRIGFSSDFVLSNNRIGIGTTNPTATLTVVGNTNIIGVITATTLSGTISGDISLNQLGYVSSGSSSIGTITTSNQTIDTFSRNTYSSSRYNISIACTGQLIGSFESPSTASVTSLTAGKLYIPGIYYNVPVQTNTGVGSDARANIIVNGTSATVGFTSAYNTLVTNAAHGLTDTNQPVSFGSSILRAEYVTLVTSNVLYTPVTHGIGVSEAVSFGSSMLNTGYTGIAVTAGTTYYATGTGSTSFTIQYSIGGGQVTNIGNTSFSAPGNRTSLPGVAVTAGTIYYATSIGSTAFTLARQSTGIGTVVGIAITTGLSIGATISSGVNAVQIVYPGSGYTLNDVLSVDRSFLGSSIVGTGFSFRVGGVSTNRQSSDFMVLTSNSGVDYVEYVSTATSSFLGSFDAIASGNNAVLRFSPYFKYVNLKFIRNSVVL